MQQPTGPVSESSYLDIQGALGITKHNGGMPATLELLQRCHVSEAREVLYVGSGIGVGPCAIARRSACRVVALDISEKMLEWSCLRAKEAGFYGGLSATLELLRLCRVADAGEVLYVGSGIGVGPCAIARRSGCRIVALDISEKMLEWSRPPGEGGRLLSRIEFRQGDVLDLPLETGRYDAVLVESVLAFVEDKARAIRECVRVTAPGGFVGMNETVWLSRPAELKLAERASALGAYIPTSEEWQRLWDLSGLEERSVSIQPTGVGSEVISRIQWVGFRWMLRAMGRLIRLLREHPESRQAIKAQFAAPAEVARLFGYGLSSGRKPARAAGRT